MPEHTAEQENSNPSWLKIKPFVLISMSFSVQERYHLRLKLEIENFLLAHKLRIKHIHDSYLQKVRDTSGVKEAEKEAADFEAHMRLLFVPQFVSPLGNQDMRICFLADSLELAIRMPSFEYGRNQHYGVYFIPDFGIMDISDAEQEHVIDIDKWFSPEKLQSFKEKTEENTAQQWVDQLYQDIKQKKTTLRTLIRGVFPLDFPVQGQTILKIDNFVKFDLGLNSLKGILELSIKNAYQMGKELKAKRDDRNFAVLPLIGLDWNEIAIWTFSESVQDITRYVKSVVTTSISDTYDSKIKGHLTKRIKSSFLLQKLRTFAFYLKSKQNEQLSILTDYQKNGLVNDFHFMLRLLCKSNLKQKYSGYTETCNNFESLCASVQSLVQKDGALFPEIVSESILYKAFFEQRVQECLYGKIDFLFVDYDSFFPERETLKKINPIPYSSTFVGVPLEYIVFCCLQGDLNQFSGIFYPSYNGRIARTASKIFEKCKEGLTASKSTSEVNIISELLKAPHSTAVTDSLSRYFSHEIVDHTIQKSLDHACKYSQEATFIGAILTELFYHDKNKDRFSVYIDIPMLVHGFQKADRNGSGLNELRTVLGKSSLRKNKKKISIWKLTKFLIGVYTEVEQYLFSSSYTSISVLLLNEGKSKLSPKASQITIALGAPPKIQKNLNNFSQNIRKKVSTKHWRLLALTPKMLSFFRQLTVSKHLVEEYIKIVDTYNYHIEDNVQFEDLLEFNPILWKVYYHIKAVQEFSPNGYIGLRDGTDRRIEAFLSDLSHLSESFRNIFFTRFTNAKLDPDAFNRTMEKTGVQQTLLAVAAGIQRVFMTNIIGQGWQKYIHQSSLLVERDEEEIKQGNQLVPETTITRRYLFDLEHLAQLVHEIGHSYNLSQPYEKFCRNDEMKGFLMSLFYRAEEDFLLENVAMSQLFSAARQIIPDLITFSLLCDNFQDFLDYYLFHVFDEFTPASQNLVMSLSPDSEQWLRLAILYLVVNEERIDEPSCLIEGINSHFSKTAFRNKPTGDFVAPSTDSFVKFLAETTRFGDLKNGGTRIFGEFQKLIIEPFKKVYSQMVTDCAPIKESMQKHSNRRPQEGIPHLCSLEILELPRQSEGVILAQLRSILEWIIGEARKNPTGQNILIRKFESAQSRPLQNSLGLGNGVWDIHAEKVLKKNVAEGAPFYKIEESSKPWGFSLGSKSPIYLHPSLGAFVIKTSARQELFYQRTTALFTFLNCTWLEKGVLAGLTLDRRATDINLTKNCF